MTDLVKPREHMVEEQIEARGVRSKIVLNAMRKVPREAFLPERLREFAYEDLGLTRFGGHPEAFARGAADAKNTPSVFAGISPTDGRAGPCWP